MGQKQSKNSGRSAAFRAARRQHGTEAAEDYCELIADLVEESGEARTCNIARDLGISHVTALRTIRRLQDEGYVTTAPHRPVELTAQGREIARKAKIRHKLLVDFFIALGVPAAVAEVDVEGAEHHISEATQQVIRRFMRERG